MVSTMTAKAQDQKLLVSTFQTLEIVSVSSIVHVEAYENYCKLHTVTGEVHLSTNSFGSTNVLLAEFGFFHCHKSFAVGFRHIKRVHKSGDIELVTGAKVPLARRRKELFYEELDMWCRWNQSRI